MNLKLITTGRVSFTFCGKVAVTYKNTEDNPVEVVIEDLDPSEVIGLSRALRTGVIKAVEGLEGLEESLKNIEENKKSKALNRLKAQDVEAVKEEVSPVQETEILKDEEVQEDSQDAAEDQPQEEVKEGSVAKEEEPVKKTVTRRRRAPVKKSEDS